MLKSVVLGGDHGFGESIVIIFPNGSIGIIDSFTSSKTGNPLAIDYLEENDLNFEQVDFVMLTHFHQDHYTGISQILEKCKQARFFCPNIVSLKSFQFLAESQANIKSHFNFFTEWKRIIDELKGSRRKIISISAQSEKILDTADFSVYVVSPSIETRSFFDEKYKRAIQALSISPGQQVEIKGEYNLQSAVVIVDMKYVQCLFGADLEYYSKSEELGWQSVYNHEKFKNRTFRFFKVPHHGSDNAFNATDWKEFLSEESILTITPYKSTLPKPKEISGIRALFNQSYITSIGSYSKIPFALKKKLGNLNIKKLSKKSGYIEVAIDQHKTDISLSGKAVCLNDISLPN